MLRRGLIGGASAVMLARAALAQVGPVGGPVGMQFPRQGPGGVGGSGPGGVVKIVNRIRNSTMVGAVAGTPGTLPTNWTQTQNTGIIPAVIGTGVESGLSYLDLHYVGTGAVGTNNNLLFDGTISGGPNQVWTQSAYLRLVAGAWSGVPSIFWLDGDNIATVPAVGAPNMLTATSAGLSTQRFISTFTTNAGAVTSVKQGLIFITTIGAAIDFTIRIGAPQLERGAFANSWVPTP